MVTDAGGSTYLLLGEVLAVQRTGGRADVHEGLLETLRVALDERETEIQDRVLGCGAGVHEAIGDLIPYFVQLHAARHQGLGGAHGGEACEEGDPSEHLGWRSRGDSGDEQNECAWRRIYTGDNKRGLLVGWGSDGRARRSCAR